MLKLFTLLCASALAHTITGIVDKKGSPLEFQHCKISVNSGEFNALVDNSGRFQVGVPSEGTYKLEVHHVHYYFEPVVVEVMDEEFAPGKHMKVFLFSLKEGRDYRLKYPLELEPSSKFQYFEEKAPFDPLVYLKNPFVIMIGMTLLLS